MVACVKLTSVVPPPSFGKELFQHSPGVRPHDFVDKQIVPRLELANSFLGLVTEHAVFRDAKEVLQIDDRWASVAALELGWKRRGRARGRMR